MNVSHLFSLLVAAMLTLSSATSAQRRPPGSAVQETAPVSIALKVGGATYNFNGPAVCEHLPRGSIYDIPAERWSVRHDEAGRNLSLTLWHPLSGRAT
jgi:hypothetical protein